jgi:hypothetical protein
MISPTHRGPGPDPAVAVAVATARGRRAAPPRRAAPAWRGARAVRWRGRRRWTARNHTDSDSHGAPDGGAARPSPFGPARARPAWPSPPPAGQLPGGPSRRHRGHRCKRSGCKAQGGRGLCWAEGIDSASGAWAVHQTAATRERPSPGPSSAQRPAALAAVWRCGCGSRRPLVSPDPSSTRAQELTDL